MAKVTFIAEAGKNFIDHDWKQGAKTIPYYVERAITLIKEAKKAGADVIKFQCHVAKDEIKFRNPSRKEWIYFNENITPITFWEELKRHCDVNEIEFLVTPMSKMAAEKINYLVKRWKVGSGNVTDYELLKYLAETKKPVILSIGMSTRKEIEQAIDILKDNELSLLYCVSIYPCPREKIDFRVMDFLRRYDCAIGFSDHTIDITTPSQAVICGATIIEKHFTLDKTDIGPDHMLSLNPEELKWAIKLVRDYEFYQGKSGFYPYEEEIRLRMKFNI